MYSILTKPSQGLDNEVLSKLMHHPLEKLMNLAVLNWRVRAYLSDGRQDG